MRAIRVASLTLIGTAAALALSAPAALAADDDGSAVPPGDGSGITSFGFTVSPEEVAPGGTVTLNATECESPAVTVSSGVFDTVTLSEGLPATAKIFADAKPGAEYDITFDCKGEKGTTTLTVSGSGSHTGTDPDTHTGTGTGADTGSDTGADAGSHTGTGAHTGTGSHTPGDPAKPGGGVRAGAGGSLPGLSPAQLAVGSALVAGAVGGGAVLLLRRRARDGG
ncbi:hypothetical protein ACWF94_22600 [Streptomyces sp. NPDC055078]